MISSKITKEKETELMKKTGKTSISEVAESSKFVPFIGIIIGGTISGSINLVSTIGINLVIIKFFRYIICSTAGANYILVKIKEY